MSSSGSRPNEPRKHAALQDRDAARAVRGDVRDARARATFFSARVTCTDARRRRSGGRVGNVFRLTGHRAFWLTTCCVFCSPWSSPPCAKARAETAAGAVGAGGPGDQVENAGIVRRLAGRIKQWPQRSPGPRSSRGAPRNGVSPPASEPRIPGNTGPGPSVLSEAPDPLRYIVRALKGPDGPFPSPKRR
jgi:hypothetical protein